MRPNILGRATDDEERLGGRQNSLSRAQLIIKAAAGTVKLSRSAIRELRVRGVVRRHFQGPRFRVYNTSIPIPIPKRDAKIAPRGASVRDGTEEITRRWASYVNRKSADGLA